MIYAMLPQYYIFIASSEIRDLFRRVSLCVRFVIKRRESTRQNRLRGVERLSRQS